MRAITLWQPWATLIAVGAKQIETRSWYTGHRGPLAIHAGKTKEGWADEIAAMIYTRILREFGWEGPVPYSRIIAVCRLVDCVRTETVHGRISDLEKSVGDFSPGRYAWILRDVKKLEIPVVCRGHQGLWKAPSTGMEHRY